MILTPHALLGAYVGLKRGPAASLSSHYVLDRIPHEDYPLEGYMGAVWAGIDLGVAICLVENLPRRARLGALLGIAPDIMTLLNKHSLLPEALQPLQEKHDKAHTNIKVPAKFGWGVQVIVAFGLLYLLKGHRNAPK